MNIEYTAANPRSGDESFLLKFHLTENEASPCLLVDSGEGVNVDDMLESDEYLAGILLTHAHLDHFESLPSNVKSDVPVYTSPATASLIEHVLEEGDQNFGSDSPDLEEVLGDTAWTDSGWDTSAIVHAIEPVDDWQTILANIEIKPIPAGHTPGAAGFILRFRDDGETNHIVITGDFSFSSVAGYPGMAEHLPVDVDALFLNHSGVGSKDAELTASLNSIIEGVTAGKRVLTTASGLTGVHYAALLGHLVESSDANFGINIVGQAAKLYDDLDYDFENVSAIPVYNSATDVLMPGCVTITGPEVPVTGGAKKLYNEIQKDAGSKLVQIAQSMQAVDGAVCETDAFSYARHPSQDDVDAFIEETNPTGVIYQHGNKQFYDGTNPDKYEFAYEWLIDEKNTAYALYGSDDGWKSPPWVNDLTTDMIRAENKERGTFSDTFGTSQVGDLPSVARRPIDLDLEGVNVDALPLDYTRPPEPPQEPVQEEVDAADEPTPATASDATTAEPETPDTEPDTGTNTDGVKATDGGSATAEHSAADDTPSTVEPDTPETEPTTTKPAEQPPETEASAAASQQEILDRLDRIEAAVEGEETEATVVEADGVTLLQIDGDDLPAEAAHGDTVTISVDG